ncbi:MAG TPA: hypothetical protein VK188_00860 [Holophaga sp.]|nr:hypothetical protein [Holophaga sp.]
MTNRSYALGGLLLLGLLSCESNVVNDRSIERLATPSPEFPLAGFWKIDPKDEFGLAIFPAGSGYYSISFCGPGGCFKPGTYRPNSRIVGDPSYVVVNDDAIKVSTSDGFQLYRRVKGR